MVTPRALAEVPDGPVEIPESVRTVARGSVDVVWRARPLDAARAIGRGLRELHDALPVAECPFGARRSSGPRTGSFRTRTGSGRTAHRGTSRPCNPRRRRPISKLESISDAPTLFERIVAREIPATIVYEDAELIAFRDIAPKADLHVLVVPKTVYPTVVELAAADAGLLARLIGVAQRIATEHANGEFRLVFNCGAGAGQSVPHAHGHVLSGGLDEGSVGHEF